MGWTWICLLCSSVVLKTRFWAWFSTCPSLPMAVGLGSLKLLFNSLAFHCCCSVVKSCLTLRFYEPQRARLLCPSLSPMVYSNSCLLRQWSFPTVSSPVIPFLLLPSIFPSIRFFPTELALCIRCPKYWSFNFSISPSIKYSEMISFRIGWFYLLAVHGTLKSLLWHHSSKVSIFQSSGCLMVQLPHPCMTVGGTIALTVWGFVGKVLSLLLIHCIVYSYKEQESFNSVAAVTIYADFGTQKSDIWHCFHIFPIYLPWSDGTRCHDLGFLNAEF